jgi:hypothetical protein
MRERIAQKKALVVKTLLTAKSTCKSGMKAFRKARSRAWHIIKYDKHLNNWTTFVLCISTTWVTSYVVYLSLTYQDLIWMITPTLITACAIVARLTIWWLYKDGSNNENK